MLRDADATVGLTLDLPVPEAVIGRSTMSGATVLIDCPAVAKRHARVVRAGGGPTIEDLGSRNGTSVNGARLRPAEPVPLADGDEVCFAARLTFIFRVQPTLEAAAEPGAVADPPKAAGG